MGPSRKYFTQRDLSPKHSAPARVISRFGSGKQPNKSPPINCLAQKDLESPEIHKRATGKVQPESIVLFHNAALHTPEALPGIIETLLREGYTIDHTGRQCPAKM